MRRNFVAAEQAAVERDPDIFGHGLATQLTFRLSVPMNAQIQMRALIEKSDPSKIVRRWLRAGAKAEGFDLDAIV